MITSLILKIIEHGAILCLIAVLAETLLIFYGFTRGNTISVVLFTFIGATLSEILNGKTPYYVYALFILFVTVAGSNRFDLMSTAIRGRWWWKSEDRNKKT